MFYWNSGMVPHILKRDPALRDLEHVQVDGPGTAYLFFYDKQGHKGLRQEVVENIQAHIAEMWISHSTHFVATLLPLVEQQANVTPDPRQNNRTVQCHMDC